MCKNKWIIIFLILAGITFFSYRHRQNNKLKQQSSLVRIEIDVELQGPERIDSEKKTTQIKKKTATAAKKNRDEKITGERKEAAKTKKATQTTSKTSTKPAAQKTISSPAGTHQPIATPATTVTERTIAIENAITKKMLGYSYFGTHYPTLFKVAVNGKEIEPNNKELIKIANNQIAIRYNFEFLKGKYKGAKEVIYSVKPTTENISISFDWKNKWHILVDQEKAEPVSAQEIK